jgi:ankyrin repeat protein
MTAKHFPTTRTTRPSFLHQSGLLVACATTGLALLISGCEDKGSSQPAAATGVTTSPGNDTAVASTDATTKAQDASSQPAKAKATTTTATTQVPTKPDPTSAKRPTLSPIKSPDKGLDPKAGGEILPKLDPLPRAGAAEPGATRAPSPIKFEPGVLDLGELTAEVAKTGIVKIVNTSDAPVKITKAIPGCGCTTLGWPREPIPAGESADVEVTLKPGPKQGIRLKKRVTFQLEGHPSQVLTVEGEVAAYVIIKPDIIAARVEEEELSEEIILTSADGTPFIINEVFPAIVTETGKEPALEHVVRLDWSAWEESNRPVKLAFRLDHPKAKQVTALVKRRSPRSPKTPDLANQQNVPSINDLSGAARAGDVQRVKLLLADSKDPNQADRNGGRTPMHWAVRNNNVEIVDLLIEAGADVNKGDQAGKTPLSHAAESGKVDMTKKLIEAGSDVNKRDLVGGNSVLWAAGLGSAETLEIVVNAGGQVDVKDINGLTPLQWAAQTGKTASMVILINAGADVNSTDNLNGESVLMRAARSGRIESIDLLLRNDARTDTRTKLGSNVLHIASEYGNVEIVMRLVEQGLDPKSTDARDWTALDYAKNRVDEGRFAVIAYLTPQVEDAPAADGEE